MNVINTKIIEVLSKLENAESYEIAKQIYDSIWDDFDVFNAFSENKSCFVRARELYNLKNPNAIQKYKTLEECFNALKECHGEIWVDDKCPNYLNVYEEIIQMPKQFGYWYEDTDIYSAFVSFESLDENNKFWKMFWFNSSGSDTIENDKEDLGELIF